MHFHQLTVLVFFSASVSGEIREATEIPDTLTATETARQQMKYLGTEEGKSFFMDEDVSLNWEQAGEYCQSFNLKLASIEKYGHRKLLTEVLSKISNPWFWSSAREARFAKMFVWNGTETQPDMYLLKEWAFAYSADEPYYYCGAFNLYDNQFKMVTEKCSSVNKFVCQT